MKQGRKGGWKEIEKWEVKREKMDTLRYRTGTVLYRYIKLIYTVVQVDIDIDTECILMYMFMIDDDSYVTSCMYVCHVCTVLRTSTSI